MRDVSYPIRVNALTLVMSIYLLAKGVLLALVQSEVMGYNSRLNFAVKRL